MPLYIAKDTQVMNESTTVHQWLPWQRDELLSAKLYSFEIERKGYLAIVE